MENAIITTLIIALSSAILVYVLDKLKKRKIQKNDSIRRERISELIDQLCLGVKQITVAGVYRRDDEIFLASGVFSYSPSYRLGKGSISHKSRIVLSDKAFIISDWDCENRWSWSEITKIEIHSDGFTIFPEKDAVFRFKTSSIARPEMEIITMMGMENCHRGTISHMPILPYIAEIKA